MVFDFFVFLRFSTTPTHLMHHTRTAAMRRLNRSEAELMAVNEHLEEENKALRDRVRGTHSRMALHASEPRKVPAPSASQAHRDELRIRTHA
jgi:hypothetical protein